MATISQCAAGVLSPLIFARSPALKLLVPYAPDEIADADQWLFLDTETTGLAGGSGTYAFLVGIAWWEGGGLEIEQFFLREYSEERALLFALRERIAEHPVSSRSTANHSTGHCSKPAIA